MGSALSPAELVWGSGSSGVPRDPGSRVHLGIQKRCSRVGLTNRNLLAIVFLLPGLLSAAPKLRLSASTVGPLSIAQGTNGATQTVEAYNAGDGSLGLALKSSVSW